MLASLAAATNWGSDSVSSNAVRNALTRSAGTSGAVRIGRPTATSPERISRIWRWPSLSPSSLHSGTSGKSGSRLGPTWNRMLILWSRSQSACVDFIDAQESLPAPVQLAPLHGQIDIAAAGIARHNLELGSEQIVRYLRIEHGGRTRPCRSNR